MGSPEIMQHIVAFSKSDQSSQKNEKFLLRFNEVSFVRFSDELTPSSIIEASGPWRSIEKKKKARSGFSRRHHHALSLHLQTKRSAVYLVLWKTSGVAFGIQLTLLNGSSMNRKRNLNLQPSVKTRGSLTPYQKLYGPSGPRFGYHDSPTNFQMHTAQLNLLQAQLR